MKIDFLKKIRNKEGGYPSLFTNLLGSSTFCEPNGER